jgi:KaiC/GvpD/RAD55 family RecA-like ATPase|tara:strand:+ start:1582 stop:2646 length:1065 start_codon:yes stop_codon:yes gene_type:complete
LKPAINANEFNSTELSRESKIQVSLLPPASNKGGRDMTWLKRYEPTIEELSAVRNPEWLYHDLIIRGHVSVIPAPPNEGKTTLMMWIAGQIAQSPDRQVVYVNADVSGADAYAMKVEADEMGFTMLQPQIKQGASMESIIEELRKMNDAGGDFSNCVFFFDTLKKMVDLLNKPKTKELFTLLRGLCAKGMTIVLLAHTNKYKDKEKNGAPIFEGVGDVRADVDEMIYLEACKSPDGSMVITTKPDKIRGNFKPISFNVNKDRRVTPAEKTVDIQAEDGRRRLRDRHEQSIRTITSALSSGCENQSEIITYVKERGIPLAQIRDALKAYSAGEERIWEVTKGPNNSSLYNLLHSQ